MTQPSDTDELLVAGFRPITPGRWVREDILPDSVTTAEALLLLHPTTDGMGTDSPEAGNEQVNRFTTLPETQEQELPGALELARAVREGKWPHSTDARVWAKEWLRTIEAHPTVATDEGTMIGWFANALQAGQDNAYMALHDSDYEATLCQMAERYWGDKGLMHFIRKAGEELVELAEAAAIDAALSYAGYGGRPDRVRDEAGDLHFCVASVLALTGCTLSESLAETIAKVEAKQEAQLRDGRPARPIARWRGVEAQDRQTLIEAGWHEVNAGYWTHPRLPANSKVTTTQAVKLTDGGVIEARAAADLEEGVPSVNAGGGYLPPHAAPGHPSLTDARIREIAGNFNMGQWPSTIDANAWARIAVEVLGLQDPDWDKLQRLFQCAITAGIASGQYAEANRER